MFFGILLTTEDLAKVFKILKPAIVVLLILIVINILSPSKGRNLTAVKLSQIVESQSAVSADYNAKKSRGDSGIVDIKISSITITPPPDLRVRLKSTTKIRNVTDQVAIGTIFHVVIKSSSLSDHYIETDVYRDFNPPLLPGDVRDVEWEMSSISISALSSDLFDPISHSALAGTHNVSDVDATLTAIKVRGSTPATPKLVNVGPTDSDRGNIQNADELVRICSALIKSLNNNDPEKFEFTETELAENKDCVSRL